MDKIGWKVVYKNSGGSLQSAVVVGDWCLGYEIGKRTTGRGDTPVLAFRSRESARLFKHSNCWSGGHVFKAKLDNPRPQKLVAEPTYPHTFKAFWEQGLAASNRQAPTGTLACNAITLLEPA